LILFIAVIFIIALFISWLYKRSETKQRVRNNPPISKYYADLIKYPKNRLVTIRKETEIPVSHLQNEPIEKDIPAPSNIRSPGGHYNVYVIELDRGVMNSKKFRKRNRSVDPCKPCFYVGYTWHNPEYRFKQQLSGEKSSYFPRTYGKKLRPDIYGIYNPMKTKGDAERMKEELAEWLETQGHGVWWN